MARRLSAEGADWARCFISADGYRVCIGDNVYGYGARTGVVYATDARDITGPTYALVESKVLKRLFWFPIEELFSDELQAIRSRPIARRDASRRTAVQYDSDGYPVECLYSDGYGDSSYGPCSGGAELFPAPSGTGTMIGYCPKHYDKALERDRETRDRLGNPDSDFAPDWLDPADIGERWDYDY